MKTLKHVLSKIAVTIKLINGSFNIMIILLYEQLIFLNIIDFFLQKYMSKNTNIS